MSRRTAIPLLPIAVTAALALAGCGGGSADPADSRPDDFAFTFAHSDGSVAPPAHIEWTVVVGPDGDGRATYTPDYGSKGVPVYKAKFTVSDDDLDAIYADMRGAGLLERIEPPEDEPIGGDVETARIYAGGETFDVPPFDDSGAAPLAAVSEQVRALVPESDWRSFERRRNAYAQQRYGEQP